MPKYQICINGLPIGRSKFIKALRLTGHLGLNQALDLTIHFERFVHSILVAGIDLPAAEHIAGALRDAGSDVEVQPSSVATPMLCTPQANAKFAWSWFNSIKLGKGPPTDAPKSHLGDLCMAMSRRANSIVPLQSLRSGLS